MTKRNLIVLKQATYLDYILRMISLTGTLHSQEFWEDSRSVPKIFGFFVNKEEQKRF